MLRAWLTLLLLLSSLSGYSLEIRGLGKAPTVTMQSLMKGKTVWILFRPDCSACKLQMKSLDCLEDLSKVRIVGIDAGERELYREAKRFEVLKKMKPQQSGPFYGDGDVLKHLDVKHNYSPQLLFFAEGKKLVHHLGALECQKLRQVIL